MKILLTKVLFVSSMLLLSLSISAQQKLNLQNLELTIKGSSNVHDWQSSVEQVKALATGSVNQNGELDLQNLEVSIEVENIKSEHGRIMDRNTREALKAEDHPVIRFVQTAFSNQAAGNKAKIASTGKLTIAGTTRDVTLHATGSHQGGGLLIEGSYPMKMTDFGVEPPTAMLGTMRTADEVTIHFRFNLELPAAGSR